MSTWIKICGITRQSDAICCAELGVDAIGLNFAPLSPRHVSREVAASIVAALRATQDPPEIVGVFVDASVTRVAEAVAQIGLDSVQLHGHESPQQLEELRLEGISAFKAVRIGSEEDVRQAFAYGEGRIVVDAKVPGAMGGTGHTFDWDLIKDLKRARHLVLAGGLRPDNVLEAVKRVRPFGVDTASGVESSPGIKESSLIRSFVRAVRRAG